MENYFSNKKKRTEVPSLLNVWCGALLQVEKKPTRVFDHIFDTAQEEYCLSAVDQSMIVCQSDVHHRPWDDVTINHHRTGHYGVHA